MAYVTITEGQTTPTPVDVVNIADPTGLTINWTGYLNVIDFFGALIGDGTGTVTTDFDCQEPVAKTFTLIDDVIGFSTIHDPDSLRQGNVRADTADGELDITTRAAFGGAPIEANFLLMARYEL